MSTCNICGGQDFGPAPANRLSRKGLAPLCLKCRSLERHRITRSISTKLRIREKFSEYSLVSWGGMGGVAKGWFKKVDLFGAEHPDAGLTRREPESVDFILCTDVLQRVPDHRNVVANMTQKVSHEGLILLTYPNPINREVTEDWNGLDPKRGQNYRIFGRDFEEEFAIIIPEAIVIRLHDVDPVTGDADISYILTKNPFWMRRLFQIDIRATILD